MEIFSFYMALEWGIRLLLCPRPASPHYRNMIFIAYSENNSDSHSSISRISPIKNPLLWSKFLFDEWLGMRDSNPRCRIQSPEPYRLANSQYAWGIVSKGLFFANLFFEGDFTIFLYGVTFYESSIFHESSKIIAKKFFISGDPTIMKCLIKCFSLLNLFFYQLEW